MALRLNLLLASCMLVPLITAQGDQPASPPTTKIQFEGTEHDFGWILQDSRNTYVFKFKNTGDIPLIIESATGSCGCTVPDYPKHPILPGEESAIEVVYSPGKQEGHQLKMVTVIANTKPAQTVLRIHAEVFTAAPGVASEPYTFDPLPPPVEHPLETLASMTQPSIEAVPDGPITKVRFDEWEHDFGQVLQGSENPYVFRFKNTGDVPLVIANAQGSCGCTVPYYDKEPIPPGEESEIHVVYKPGKQEGHQQKQVTISANTEPRQTILRIKTEVLVVDAVTASSLFAMDEEHEKDRKAIEALTPGCFVVFPNPASHELRLDLKEHIGRSADVRIDDQTGRNMLRTRIDEINSETSRLDITAFQAGIYIVTIQVEGGPPMSQCFAVNR